MQTDHQKLWQQIEAFEFDTPGTRLSFGQRLARENNWSAAFTRSVLSEYKRYVFLAMTAGHPVCPSDAVDQAWHLHLTYTRSYWDDFCGRVLGRPLHHGPTRGGREEDVKHHEMYAKTLAAYRDAFGHEAPADVWHPADVRFGEDVAFSRVNTLSNWVIPKPRWMRKAALAGAAVLAVSAAGCFSPMASLPVLAAGSPVFPWFAIAAILFFAIRSRMGKERVELLPEDMSEDVYAIATLNGGGTFAVNAAMIELARRRLVEVQSNGRVLKLLAAPGVLDELHPFERAVYDGIHADICDVKEVRQHMRPWIDGMITHLRKRGLAMTEAEIEVAQGRRLLPLVVVLVAGLFVAISDGFPGVGVLVGAVVGGVLIVKHMKRRPFRTARGNALIAAMTRSHPAPRAQERDGYRNPAFDSGSFAMMAALYGTTILAGTAFGHMDQALTPRRNDSGGCGGGCGGGGCDSFHGSGDGGASDGGGGGDGGASSGCGGGGSSGCGGGGCGSGS